MDYKNRVSVIIPSLSPDERLVTLVKELKEHGFEHIVVVNDGSSEEYDSYFEQTKALGARVLRHVVNQGKGRALKTAFHHILECGGEDILGAVTIDSDGQHALGDIIRCCEALTESPGSFIMGCRDFKQSHVPFKSSFGNILTSKVMELLVGIKISDTQTGLRGMSCENMKKFLAVSGERFEYETNMLLCCKEESVPIREVPIQTIYFEGNKSTHFRPLQDSFMIYKLFFAFVAASLSSAVIDLGLFAVATFFLRKLIPAYYILISTIIARVFSSLYNFFVNRQKVFKSGAGIGKTMVKYYSLAVIQMGLSAFGVWSLFQAFGGSETLIKILVDVVLFFVSFQIQREWIFKKKD